MPASVARVCIVLIVLGCYPLAFNAHRANVTLLLPQRWQDALAATPTVAATVAGTEAVGAGTARLLPQSASVQGGGAPDAGVPRGLAASLRREAPHALLTAALVALSTAVGIAVPDVETVLAYKGALGGSWIIYIFPACVWFALLQMRSSGGPVAGAAADTESLLLVDGAAAEGLKSAPASSIWRLRDVFFTRRGVLMLAMVLWGLVVLFVGTITTALGI